MFNYPQPLFLKHSNKLYPFIISTYQVHMILLFGETRFVLNKHIYLIIVVLFLALTEDEK